ncbi:uncharacterized protein DMAD_11070 [Drosophila madeirensis]|uniref:Plus3 domain-containing protein n=1 Tax=Drosophila madeirensis TaxID=30013 RepID=A0AAU9FBX8_DROMD
MSAEGDLDDFESWMAMQGPEADALGVADTAETAESISQQLKEEQETIEERSEIPAKPDDNFEPWKIDMTEFDDPTQMSLEQLEEIQQMYLRRLEHEDLEDGECLDTEALAGQKERSLSRRPNLEIQRAVNDRSTALQRLQAERLHKFAKKSNDGGQHQQDRISKWVPDGHRDRGKLSKKDKRLREVCKVKLRASDIYSDNSSDSSGSEADNDDDGLKSKTSPTLRSKLEELHKVVLKRSQLTDFVDKPIFEETVIDCFIHMPGENLQATVYQITSVVKAKQPYQLGNKLTHYMLRLRHCRFDRSARLDSICNNPVEPEAFQNWIANCEKDNCPLPELSLLAKKLQDITKATDYQFSEDDVAAIIKKKRESGQRKEKIAVLKIRLIEQRDLALSNNNQEEVARLESEIEEIDRDQNKHRFGYSGVKKGLRFGGSLRSGLKPYVPKMTVPESQHRREAALVPAIPRPQKSRGALATAAAPLPADGDADSYLSNGEVPSVDAACPYIPRLLQVSDKAKAPGCQSIAAVARLLKPVAAKRSLSKISPKPENVELGMRSKAVLNSLTNA